MRPSKEFTIHLLDDADFDLLPYNGTRDALGLSDMKKKTAFIRKTGVKELDMGTINHEFDELMQETSPHEIDGIRYKSGSGWGKIFGPIIGTIVGMFNPVLGAAVGAAISGGTQAHSQSVKPEKYGSGFGGIAKSAALGGAGAYGGASLINAGRVAATNAAIAGGTGNTLATFGAGLKGAASAAAPQLASAGFDKITSMGTAPQQQTMPGFAPQAPAFNPSQTTAAFAPQAQSALSRTDFDTSMAKLTSNAAAREKSVFERFRGLGGSDKNTAFSGALSSARSSSDLARKQFLQDQKTLGSTFV